MIKFSEDLTSGVGTVGDASRPRARAGRRGPNGPLRLAVRPIRPRSAARPIVLVLSYGLDQVAQLQEGGMMNVLQAVIGNTQLQDLTLDQLAVSPEAADIVARLTRTGDDRAGSEPIRVAAFNSFI
jgi:hypothetical protein